MSLPEEHKASSNRPKQYVFSFLPNAAQLISCFHQNLSRNTVSLAAVRHKSEKPDDLSSIREHRLHFPSRSWKSRPMAAYDDCHLLGCTSINIPSHKPENEFSSVKLSPISNPADFLMDFISIEGLRSDPNVCAA